MVNPTYSICIPVYERVFGFRDALSSALSVEECTEIVVVDDNSTHNEFEHICNSFNDRRIIFVKNKKNVGLFGNWNQCINLSTGKYVSILCSDDIIESQCFKHFLNVITTDPNVDIFFGSFCTFENNVNESRTIKQFRRGLVSPKFFLEDMAINGPAFPVLTIASRTLLLNYPFVATPHSGNDWLWIYSNASNFTLYATDIPLSYWRIHANQDANLRQSITMDCWPLMYENVYNQLKLLDSHFAVNAKRRAIGTILSFILNDKTNSGYWGERFTSKDDNMFIKKMKDIILENWLLRALLKSKGSWKIYYNIGRICRKMKIYPAY